MKHAFSLPGRIRLTRIRKATPGQAPGTVLATPEALATRIDAISFGADDYEEQLNLTLAAALEFKAKHRAVWIQLEGLQDAATIRELGLALGLHLLTLEDVVQPHQRAKVEYFPDYVYIVVRMLTMNERLESEQLSIILGRDYVLSFQEGKPGDTLEPVRERLRTGTSSFGHSGPDYLAYALLDSVIDHYFPVLERYADRLEGLEAQVFDKDYVNVVWQLNGLKRELLQVQTLILPQRDLVQSLIREPSLLVSDETRLHLRDIVDHDGQLIDLVMSYREMAQALIEIHLNMASNRMNEVMQVLTIFGAIFMPLSFIAGVYGMNFDSAHAYNMPELRWRYGYLFALGLMALVAVSLIVYFQRKGWLRRSR